MPEVLLFFAESVNSLTIVSLVAKNKNPQNFQMYVVSFLFLEEENSLICGSRY